VTPEQQFNDAVSQLRAGNAQMAAKLCDLYLQKSPTDANFLCLAARAAIALRDYERSRAYLRSALQHFPDLAIAHETLGDLELLQHNQAAAIRCYEQAMRIDPARALIHDKIDKAREMPTSAAADKPPVNRTQQAAPTQTIAFQDEILEAAAAEQRGDPKAAEMIYRNILKRDPNHVEAARLLAAVAVANRRFRDAEVFLRKALSSAPTYARAWVDLTNVLRELDRFEEAIDCARTVLQLAPKQVESHILLAGALAAAGSNEESIASYRDALRLAPDRAGAHSGLAHMLKTVGDTSAAIASYRQAIAAKPAHAEAYWSLANLKTFRFEQSEVETMHRLLDDKSLDDEAHCQIHNALGLEYEARGDFSEAFQHFEQCNKLRRRSETYDPVDTESVHDRLIELFNREFIEKNAGVDDFAVTPILIVGLPRSGSTLIEQILASHPLVDGTHELGELGKVIHELRRSRGRKERFPEVLANLTLNDWQAIGAEYLRRTEVFRGGAPYFIDKNPNNFIYAGVMRLALPNTRIIDARRHPMDSCFGSFKQLFASGQPFSYDLVELGEYYLQYDRLMQHWHSVLPDYICETHYESVVADLEAEVRRLLDFCGLPFDEQCLKFHETRRAVRTASSEQVRQPIYSTSVNLWRNFESHLSELIHILKPLLERGTPSDSTR